MKEEWRSSYNEYEMLIENFENALKEIEKQEESFERRRMHAERELVKLKSGLSSLFCFTSKMEDKVFFIYEGPEVQELIFDQYMDAQANISLKNMKTRNDINEVWFLIKYSKTKKNVERKNSSGLEEKMKKIVEIMNK